MLTHLHQEFNSLKQLIYDHSNYQACCRHTQIRINSWLRKLQSITANAIWCRNRNNYMRLLYMMLEYNYVIEPFSSMAPSQVPTLQKHAINTCLLKISRSKNIVGPAVNDKWKQLEEQFMISRNKPEKYQECKQKEDNYNEKNNILTPIQNVLTPLQKNYSSTSKKLYFQQNSQLEIHYFPQNREQKDQEQQEQSELLFKIYHFLQHHKESLKQDHEYGDIMSSLGRMLHVQVSESHMSSIQVDEGISLSKLRSFSQNFSSENTQNQASYY